MDQNASDALYVGVTLFMFIAAVSVGLILMDSISKLSELSLESLDRMDKTVIERTQVPPAYVVKGAEIISYYSNYVMSENSQFEFYLDTATNLTASDNDIGYTKEVYTTLDQQPFINRCVKMTTTDKAPFERLKSELENYFVKIVRKNGDKTLVYFIAAGKDYKRAEYFMYSLKQAI